MSADAICSTILTVSVIFIFRRPAGLKESKEIKNLASYCEMKLSCQWDDVETVIYLIDVDIGTEKEKSPSEIRFHFRIKLP